jgi:hypothetical protein
MNPGETEGMSTQAGAPYVLSRVAARAGLGVWRHRVGVLLASIVAVALGTYVATNWTGVAPLSLSAVTGGGNSDCADTAMAAIADKSSGVATRAYQCMDTSFQQRVSEADFVRQMQAQTLPNVQKLARIGDYRTAAGGTLVYYAVDGGAQSVGYVVYLGPDGKVLRIE